MEACLTCMSCMSLLAEPTTCVPCGHTWCAECLRDAGGACIECGGAPAKAMPVGSVRAVKVGPLGTLVSKFAFQRQMLGSLTRDAATNAAEPPAMAPAIARPIA